MKKLMLTALAMLTFAGVFAQQNSNIVLFTEGGERFYAVVNGLRMNDEPVTNLKIEDLNQPGYKLKVIFEDKALGEMDKNLYCQPGEETVYMVKKNKKGEYKLAFRSSVPLAQAPPPPPTQRVIVFNPNPQPAQTTMVVEETTTTTTTHGGGGGTGDNVSMNVNVDGFGMNVNVNTNDVQTSGSMTTTTTTTTTTAGGGFVEEPVIVEEVPCAMMGPGDYESARGSIKSKSFSDSKMTLAKQITKNNCLSAAQVAGIVELFDFEDDRLEYAKFAWDYCMEPERYYKVNDAFEFESTIEELDQYINARR